MFVIWPSVQTIRQTANSIYTEYEQLEAKHQRGHQMKFVAEEYRELEPVSQTLKAISLNVGDELRFITSLESLAKENNIEQTLRLSTDQIKPYGRRYQKLPLEITLSGTYPNILKYISSVESLETITQITEVRFTQDAKDRNQTQARIGAFVLQNQSE
jgi:Tfp pilus assembly protein PilO